MGMITSGKRWTYKTHGHKIRIQQKAKELCKKRDAYIAQCKAEVAKMPFVILNEPPVIKIINPMNDNPSNDLVHEYDEWSKCMRGGNGMEWDCV